VGARLAGAAAVPTGMGFARFTDLSVVGVGSSFVLVFSSAFLYPTESPPFDVDARARPNAQVCAAGQSCGSAR
jgi:hypothetical protein